MGRRLGPADSAVHGAWQAKRSCRPQSVGLAHSRNRPRPARVSGAARHVPAVVTALGACTVAWRPTVAQATQCSGNSSTGMRRQRESRLTRREAATLTRTIGRWWGGADVAARRRSMWRARWSGQGAALGALWAARSLGDASWREGRSGGGLDEVVHGGPVLCRREFIFYFF
jgi:hypothetical protein